MNVKILYAEILSLFQWNEEDRRWLISLEVTKWLEENNINVKEECFKLQNGRCEYGLCFTNEIDHMAFKLRWA